MVMRRARFQPGKTQVLACSGRLAVLTALALAGCGGGDAEPDGGRGGAASSGGKRAGGGGSAGAAGVEGGAPGSAGSVNETGGTQSGSGGTSSAPIPDDALHGELIHPMAIAVDAENVYIGTARRPGLTSFAGVRSGAKDGSGDLSVLVEATSVYAMAIVGDLLVFATPSLETIPLAGGTRKRILSSSGGVSADTLLQHGDRLYGAVIESICGAGFAQSVYFLEPAAGRATSVVKSVECLKGFAADDEYVYYSVGSVDDVPGYVARQSVGGGNAERLAENVEAVMGELAVHDGYLYFWDSVPGSSSGVSRVPVDGGAVERLTGAGLNSQLRVLGSELYLGRRTEVLRLGKEAFESLANITYPPGWITDVAADEEYLYYAINSSMGTGFIGRVEK